MSFHCRPDVEAAQWIELNMRVFLCSVVSGKKGSSLCKSSREFLELLHWKSTGAWLCGLMLHLCLVGITVRAVQGNQLETCFNSFEAVKIFWARLSPHFWSFAMLLKAFIYFFIPPPHTLLTRCTSKHLFLTGGELILLIPSDVW